MKHHVWILTLAFLCWCCDIMAQNWAVSDSLIADSIAVADSSDYEMPAQRNFNALRFSLDGPHHYMGDRMPHGLYFYEIGGGRMAVSDDHHHNPDPFYLMHLRFGRQFNTVSSLRVGVTGGLGFIPQPAKNTFYNSINARGTFQADYLYSITNHLMGYRPDRLLEVSGFVGAGVAYSQLFKSPMDDWLSEFNTRRFSGFVRGGFQLKLFAGPQAALAVEPYVYASTRGIDLVRSELEFYDYRMGYGFDISFIQYLSQRLSDESNAGTFHKKFSRRQRYFAGDVPDVLHHRPLIVGVQNGFGGVNGEGRTFDHSAGLSQAVYLGWWMSPSIGIRTQFGTVNIKWQDYYSSTLKNFAAYRTVGFDFMLNPLGFSRRAAWQAPAGLTVLVGYEGGYAFREKGVKGFAAFGYRGGLNLWVRLANGLRLTAEPQYAILTHKNDNQRASIDYMTRVSVGLEMMVGGDREPSLPNGSSDGESTAKPFPLGYFIGGGLGRNFTPRFFQETSRERDIVKSGLVFGGYEYTDLHGVRLSGEYMTDVFYDSQLVKDRQERYVLSAGYRLAASNLLRGINPHRRWNVSANAGPVWAIGDGTSAFGLNGGLQLDYRLGKHFSAFLAQNLYWVPGGLFDSNQTTETDLTCSFNLGLMYHFESLVQPTFQLARNTANAIGAAGVAIGRTVGAVGRAVGSGTVAVGRAIGQAGVATGRAVGQAGVAMGRAIGQAGVAAGRAVGQAGVFAGHALGQAGVATGRAIGQAGAAVGRTIGSGAAAVGSAVAGVATGMVQQQGHPFMIEYALGYQHIMHMPTKGIDTWEPQMQIGLGWWALPSFGVRMGGDLIRGSSEEHEVKAPNGTFTRYDKLRLSHLYADLLVNPLGFAPHYDWQSPAGVNLIVGRTLFNLASNNMEGKYWNNSWRLGTQLWARIDKGLRLTVEPMFSLFDCSPQSDDPNDYTSVDHRDIFSLKVGLTMLMQGINRQRSRDDSQQGNRWGQDAQRKTRWFVGLGGGVHFNKDDFRLDGGGTNSNVQLLAGYRLWSNTAVRLGEELTFDHFVENRSYELTSGPQAGTMRYGMCVNTFRYLFSSLTGQYDLMGLFNPSPNRRWELNFILGGTLSYYLNESNTVIGEQESYEVVPDLRNSPLNFSTTLGAMVAYRLSDRLSAYLNHHVYIYSFGQPRWLQYTSQIWTSSGHINTFNLGLMYHF